MDLPDNLRLADNAAFAQILEDEGEELDQIGSLAASLIDGKSESRQIALALTSQALFALEADAEAWDEGDLREAEVQLLRRFPFEDLASLVVSESSGQVLLQSETDADLLVEMGEDADVLVETLAACVEQAAGRELDVQRAEEEDLLPLSRGIVKRRGGTPKEAKARGESAEERARREREEEARRKKEREERELTAALERFSAPRFDPAKQARRVFEENGEEGARAWKADIARVRQFAIARMRAQVHSNYRHFIRIARGIAALEGEGAALRRALGEAQGTLRDVAALALHPQPPPAAPGRGPGGGAGALRGELLDELDLLLAQRRVDAAIPALAAARDRLEREERGAGARLPALQRLRAEVEERAARIRAILCDELAAAAAAPEPPAAHLAKLRGQLQQLGAGEAARRAYVRGRAALAAAESGRLKMRGDAALYGPRLAEALFGTLRATAADFRAAFGSGRPMAGFVLWAAWEVDRLVEVYRRQVFPSGNLFAIGECLHAAFAHAAQLEKRGLSFTALLIARFRPGLVQALEQYGQRLEASLAGAVAQETWRPVEVAPPTSPPRSSRAPPRRRRRAAAAAGVPAGAAGGAGPLPCGGGPLAALPSTSAPPSATPPAPFSSATPPPSSVVPPGALADPRCAGGRRLRAARDALLAAFVARRASALAAASAGPPTSSPRARSVAAALAGIAEEAASRLPAGAMRQLLSATVERLAADLRSYVEELVEGDGKQGPRRIGYGGLQLAALDLRFLAAVCGRHAGRPPAAPSRPPSRRAAPPARRARPDRAQRLVEAFCAASGRPRDVALQRAATSAALRARLAALGDLLLEWDPDAKDPAPQRAPPPAPSRHPRPAPPAAASPRAPAGAAGPQPRDRRGAARAGETPARSRRPRALRGGEGEAPEAAPDPAPAPEPPPRPPRRALEKSPEGGARVDGPEPAAAEVPVEAERGRSGPAGLRRGGWRERLAALRAADGDEDGAMAAPPRPARPVSGGEEDAPAEPARARGAAPPRLASEQEAPAAAAAGDAPRRTPLRRQAEAEDTAAEAAPRRAERPSLWKAAEDPPPPVGAEGEAEDPAARRRARLRLSGPGPPQSGQRAWRRALGAGGGAGGAGGGAGGAGGAGLEGEGEEPGAPARISIRERAAARLAARSAEPRPGPSEAAAAELEATGSASLGEEGAGRGERTERQRTLKRVESIAERRTQLLSTLKTRYGAANGGEHPSGSGPGPGGGDDADPPAPPRRSMLAAASRRSEAGGEGERPRARTPLRSSRVSKE
eukprot:tig00001130_g7253.t1